jgi:tetratricopeptide (TPR) repeat protein
MLNIFRAASRGGIPGKTLFHEHLHPRFDGYRLMAQAFLEALRAIQVIHPPQPIRWKENLFSEAQIANIIATFPKDSAGVTTLDLEFGELQMYFLIHRWPFPEAPADYESYSPLGSEITKKLAAEHLRKKIYWDAAHYQLAEYYLAQKQYEKAREEYRAVYYAFYENPFPIIKIADSYLAQEEYQLAESWYNKALKLTPEDPNLIAKIGSLNVFNNRFDSAIRHLNKALEIDSAQAGFSAEQKANIFYLLGVSYANLKNWPEAHKTIDQAITLKPDFQPAMQLKTDIRNFLSGKEPGAL